MKILSHVLLYLVTIGELVTARLQSNCAAVFPISNVPHHSKSREIYQSIVLIFILIAAELTIAIVQ